MGKITDKQKKIIESFSCERLTSDPQNEELIKSFVSKKGNLLVEYLQKNAWREDIEGKTAYYLIKSPDNEIVLFFSLQCGSLLDSSYETNGVKSKAINLLKKLKISRKISKSNDPEKKQLLLQTIEEYRAGQSITAENLLGTVKKDFLKFSHKMDRLQNDKMRDQNERIIRVGNTYPGVEIVHFCANELAKKKWVFFNSNHTMGKIMFWYFVAPIIFDIQKRVGCQYTYLFAADTSTDESLINYYENELKFERPKDMGTNKPSYDWLCTFMCQEVNDLKKHRKKYFENFNPPHEDMFV